MNRETANVSKCLAEGLHFTWYSIRGSVHTHITLGQTEFQYAEVRMAAQVCTKCQAQFPEAAVLGFDLP